MAFLEGFGLTAEQPGTNTKGSVVIESASDGSQILHFALVNENAWPASVVLDITLPSGGSSTCVAPSTITCATCTSNISVASEVY